MTKDFIAKLAPGTKPSKDAKEPTLEPVVQMLVPARLFHWDGFMGKTSMRMKFGDCTIKVNDEKGKLRGTIMVCIGGDIEFHLYDGPKDSLGHQYRISAADLWNVFCSSAGTPELMLDEK